MATITYAPDMTIFPNPERGWYASANPPGGGIPGNLTAPHPPLHAARLRALRDGPDAITLIRDCILLGMFMDTEISAERLAQIEADWAAVRMAGLKVMPRFLYDWGMLNRDPDEAILNRHVEQLAPLLDANADVIAWLQAGLYGGTGEGCRSDHGYVYEDPESDGWQRLSAAGARIYRRLLDGLPRERTMTVRYPRLKWDLGVEAALTEDEAYTGSLRARVGFYDDGFMGDEKHYAMFQLPGEMAYAAQDSSYVPFEGEISDASDYKLRPNQAVIDMVRLHQTALNRMVDEDNGGRAYDCWKANGDYDDLSRRMGYRFRMLRAELPDSGQGGRVLTLRLEMVNDGFSRPVNARGVELVLCGRRTGCAIELPIDLGCDSRLWLPGPGEVAIREVRVAPPADAPGDVYELFLNLPDPHPRLRKRAEYSIRLANENIWKPDMGYNALQHTLTLS